MTSDHGGPAHREKPDHTGFVTLRFELPIRLDGECLPYERLRDFMEIVTYAHSAYATPSCCHGPTIGIDLETYRWAQYRFLDGNCSDRSVLRAFTENTMGLEVRPDFGSRNEQHMTRLVDENRALRQQAVDLRESLRKRHEVDAIRKLELEKLKAEIDRLKGAAIADRITARCREEGV